MKRKSWFERVIAAFVALRGKPVALPTAADQDPLPETGWFWRRTITFGVSAAIWWLLYTQAPRVPAEDLLDLLSRVMVLQALILVLYLIAPSANELAQLAAAVVLKFRGGGGRAEERCEDERDRRDDHRPGPGNYPPLPPRNR